MTNRHHGKIWQHPAAGSQQPTPRTSKPDTLSARKPALQVPTQASSRPITIHGDLLRLVGRGLDERMLSLSCVLQVLLEPAADLPTKTVNVTCWEWAGTARDEGDFAADWLSEVLGKPVRLVRYMGAAPGRRHALGRRYPPGCMSWGHAMRAHVHRPICMSAA